MILLVIRSFRITQFLGQVSIKKKNLEQENIDFIDWNIELSFSVIQNVGSWQVRQRQV